MLRRFLFLSMLAACCIAILHGCNSGNNVGGGSDGFPLWSGMPTAPSGGGEGTIDGLIVDQNGAPASGAQVSVLLGTLIVSIQPTGSDGRFSINVSPGTYMVTVTKSGYASLQADNLVVTANKRTTLAMVISNSAGVLSGTIRDEQTTTLISGAQVDIVSDFTPQVKLSLTTNASGTYRGTLTIGSYTVTVSKDGYASASSKITIVPTVEKVQDFAIRKTSGRIFGNIMNQSDQPISGALVRFIPQGTGAISELTTGTDGKYSLSLKAQTYTMSVSKAGFANYQETLLIVAGSDRIFDVKLGPRVSVSGTVRLNTNSEPLPNILVKSFKSGSLIDSTRTTPEGVFTFQDLAIGLYEISVAQDSQAYAPATYVIQVLNSGAVSPASPTLFISPRISDGLQALHPLASGTIIDAYSKAPLEYVSCSLKGFGSTVTDDQGRFSFSNLGAGTYQLTFSKLGYDSMTVNFVVKDTNGTYPTSLLPPVLNYSLVESPEKDMGSIAGRFISEATRQGIDNLIVRVYLMEYRPKTISVNQTDTVTGQVKVTSKDVSYWTFLSPTPGAIKSTLTGSDLVGNESASGTFRITHLIPTLELTGDVWGPNHLYTRFQYVVYIGTNPSEIRTTVFNDPADVGATKQLWWIEDTSNPDRFHSWNCEVRENTTTYLSNFDQPNF